MKDAHPYELKNFSNIQNSAIQNWIQKGYAYFFTLTMSQVSSLFEHLAIIVAIK